MDNTLHGSLENDVRRSAWIEKLAAQGPNKQYWRVILKGLQSSCPNAGHPPRLLLLVSALHLMLLEGCGSDTIEGPFTEIVFSADEDLVIPEGSQLEIVFWADGVRQHREGQVLEPVPFERGARLRVATESGLRDPRYTVFAELTHEGERLSWLRVRGDFLQASDEERGEIHVRFGNGCPEPADRPIASLGTPGDFDAANTCGSHDSCVSGECSGACYSAAAPSDDADTVSTPGACPEGDCLAVDSIAVGRNMTCVISSGEAFCWGRVAEMFESWDHHPRRPTRVVDESGVARFASNIESIEVDSEHVCLIADGVLRCGGRNIGDFEIIGPSRPNVRPCCEIDITDGTSAEGSSFAQVSLGPSFTCAIDDLGAVVCFGKDPSTLEVAPGPNPVFGGRTGYDRILTLWANVCGFRSGNFECARDAFPFLGPDIDVVSAEVSTVCLVRDSGQLECYGRDAEREAFVDVPHIVPGSWSDVSVSTQYIGDDNAFCGITSDGELRCWGDAEGGRTGSFETVAEDDAISIGAGQRWAAVGVGQRHSCALADDDQVYCWGDNALSQLGNIRGNDAPGGLDLQHVCIPGF